MELRTTTGFQKAIGWMGCAFFAFLIAACVIARIHWIAFAIFAGFFLLSLWLLLSSGEIVITTSQIKYITFISTRIMQWDEVIAIDTDPYGASIVFQGSEKRLVIPGPSNWSATSGIASFLEQQALLRKVPINLDNLAAFKCSKHTDAK